MGWGQREKTEADSLLSRKQDASAHSGLCPRIWRPPPEPKVDAQVTKATKAPSAYYLFE